jgi:DNA-binding phage protein
MVMLLRIKHNGHVVSMAKDSQLSPTTVYRYLKGQFTGRMQVDTLGKLCRAAGYEATSIRQTGEFRLKEVVR